MVAAWETERAHMMAKRTVFVAYSFMCGISRRKFSGVARRMRVIGSPKKKGREDGEGRLHALTVDAPSLAEGRADGPRDDDRPELPAAERERAVRADPPSVTDGSAHSVSSSVSRSMARRI